MSFDPATLKFDSKGLIPAIAQDHKNLGNPDDGMDECRRRGRDISNRAGDLLVTVARGVMAQRRGHRVIVSG